VPVDDPTVTDIISVISASCNAKEVVLAAQEAIEILSYGDHSVNGEDAHTLSSPEQLSRIARIYMGGK
jgi:hypothetical protein